MLWLNTCHFERSVSAVEKSQTRFLHYGRNDGLKKPKQKNKKAERQIKQFKTTNKNRFPKLRKA